MKIQIKKVLCPVDFSACSDHALQYGVALAEAYGAELQLLHIVEPPAASYEGIVDSALLPVEALEAFQQTCLDHLKRLAARAEKQYPRVTYHIGNGIPFVGIIRSAKAENVDLIVVGTHGRTGLSHALLGSVAERLVRKAPCPVLTVKHPEHEFVMP
jgi:nucleotide-binding universal stress UspA family protein